MCNPYEFFGLPNIWPRGYPLDQIKAPECNEFSRQAVRPLILQVRPERPHSPLLWIVLAEPGMLSMGAVVMCIGLGMGTMQYGKKGGWYMGGTK